MYSLRHLKHTSRELITLLSHPICSGTYTFDNGKLERRRNRLVSALSIRSCSHLCPWRRHLLSHGDCIAFFYLLEIMQLAVALYNNDVDDEDELEFRKGDVLTVLIENPNGLHGWWLCEHKGKCGLCPANRLRPASNAAISTSRSSDQTRSSSRLSTASVSVADTSNITAIDSFSSRCTMVYRVITISRSQPLQRRRRRRLPLHRHHPTMIMISHMHQVGTIE